MVHNDSAEGRWRHAYLLGRSSGWASAGEAELVYEQAERKQMVRIPFRILRLLGLCHQEASATTS